MQNNFIHSVDISPIEFPTKITKFLLNLLSPELLQINILTAKILSVYLEICSHLKSAAK